MLITEEGACGECDAQVCTHVRGYLDAIQTDQIEPRDRLLERVEKYLLRQHGMIRDGLLDAVRAVLYPEVE